VPNYRRGGEESFLDFASGGGEQYERGVVGQKCSGLAGEGTAAIEGESIQKKRGSRGGGWGGGGGGWGGGGGGGGGGKGDRFVLCPTTEERRERRKDSKN